MTVGNDVATAAGRPPVDVLDETYRKTIKLDTRYRASSSDPEQHNLLEVVHNNLLDGVDFSRHVSMVSHYLFFG